MRALARERKAVEEREKEAEGRVKSHGAAQARDLCLFFLLHGGRQRRLRGSRDGALVLLLFLLLLPLLRRGLPDHGGASASSDAARRTSDRMPRLFCTRSSCYLPPSLAVCCATSSTSHRGACADLGALSLSRFLALPPPRPCSSAALLSVFPASPTCDTVVPRPTNQQGSSPTRSGCALPTWRLWTPRSASQG